MCPMIENISYHHDFGQLLVGTTKEHELVLHNETTVEQGYVVDFDQFATSYVSTSFFIDPMKVDKLKPQKSQIMKVLYRPMVPFKESRYYFIIIRSDGLRIHLSLKGKSVGPQVECTADVLIFNCYMPDQVQRKCFYFINRGEADALFNFDTANIGRLNINPLHGIIKSGEKIRVVVAYSSKYPKQYFYKLIKCYILHHVVIRISIINIPKRDREKIDIEQMVINPDTNSYFSPDDTTCIISTQTSESDNIESLVLLNEKFINFDHCCVGKELKKTINIKNNCGVAITVLWEEDESNVFKIYGRSQIEALSNQIVRVTFSPTKRDKIYFIDLCATIKWGQHLTSLHVTVSLLGNTLDRHGCSWPAQYLIEPEYLNIESDSSKMSLPTRAPGDTPFLTFMIRRHAELPLSFSFNRPLHTHFILNPLQGLIRGPFQIFTIEMINEESTKNAFNKERWSIEFNGGEILHQIILEGTIETPKLIINDLKPICFPTTHPLCSQKYEVIVRNPTHNLIRYQMSKLCEDNVVQIDENEHEIQSNEILKNIWSFSPPTPGEYFGEIKCLLSSNAYTYSLKISYYGKCTHGHLMTEPELFSFNTVILGCWENEIFKVINDGECALSITLECTPCTLPSIMGETYLEPQKLTIQPGTSVEVKVCTTPGGLDHHNLEIGYYIRESEDSDKLIDNNRIPLIRFDIIGDYPSWEIIDIRLNLVKFLSKIDLWTILEINRLNQLFKKMYLGQENRKTNVYLPSSMENSSPIVLEIMVKNTSSVACDWMINQEKTCSCELQEKKFGINLFKMVSVCPHVEQVTLNPKNGYMKSKRILILTLQIGYNLPGEQRQTFSIKINPSKMHWLSSMLTITFIRYAISPEMPMVWPAEAHDYQDKEIHFKMVPVFIGQLEPFVQAFWIYNSSPWPIDYEVEAKWIQNSAFSCVNSKDSIKPLTIHPLLFKFLPYELNPNKACFCLKTENKTLDIIMECESEEKFSLAKVYKMHNKMKLVSILPKNPIHLSVDHITLPFIPLHSSVDEIFYLNNYSNNKLVMRWQRISLRGILHLYVVPSEEYIDPYQRIMLKVTCKTSGQPCLINCNLNCEIEIITRNAGQMLHNKKKNARTHKENEKKLLGISVTIHANQASLQELNNQLVHKIGAEFLLPVKKIEPVLIPKERADIIVDVFNKTLWDIVSSKYFRHAIEKQFPPIYYAEFLQNYKETNKETTIRCPNGVTEHVFSNAISEILSESFFDKL